MPTIFSTLFAARPMALFNPVYALVIPSLFVVTVPLAILAGITTTLAFSVLILRVIVVYLDIALSLLPQSLASLHSRDIVDAATASSSPYKLPERRPSSPTLSSSSLKQQHALRRRRRRPSSTASAISGGGSASSIVSVVGGGERGSLGLIPSIGPERDFEGVGGWRVGGDAVDDEVWTTVNPRLEMPERPFGPHYRHHHRTPSSGGPTTPGEGGYLMMRTRNRSPEVRTGAAMAAMAPSSPNSSRARTPTGPRLAFAPVNPAADGYFALGMGTSPKTVKR
jgi:hypothetical protein